MTIIRTPTCAKGGITAEEKTALDKHAKLWISRAMRTDPIEPEKIVPAIEGIYAAAGLKKPRVVIVPSPLVMAFAYGASAAILYSRKQATDQATRQATRQATDQATWQATDQATRQATRQATERETWQATRQATDQATWQATDQATRQATRQATDQATRQATDQATDQATWQATDQATDQATWQATDQATRQATRQATDQATDQATWQATDQATDQATWQATDQATWQATDQATDQATRQATRQATWQATERATDQATERATERATDQATRQATDQATDQATWQATWQATDQATRQATRQATWQATERATDQATRQATWQATERATDQATRQATDQATNAAEKGAASACLELSGDFGLQCAQLWWRAYQGGNMWTGYDCYLSAMRDVISLRLPQHDAYSHWEQAAIHGGFRVMHEEFCIVSDFPEFIRIDDQYRPHCETGPSHRWRDGWVLYHWHGVRVPNHWIEDRERLTAADVFKEPNAEVRRAGCEIIGWDRVLAGIDAKLIDDDGDPFIGTLYRGQIPGAVECGFLKVQCGTGRVFVIPVAPECVSAIEAQAWIAGKPVAKWSQPEVRG
jgi:hypothetical protein